MMKQALSMGEFSVVEWDIQGNIIRNKYGNMLPSEGLLPEEYLARMEPEEAKILHDINTKLLTGQLKHSNLHLKLNRGTAEHPDWREYMGAGTSEKIDGKIRYIVYSAKDITQEREEERHNQMMGSKYMKIFETNLLAMSFYGPDGMLIDFNQKMRELVVVDEESERYFRNLPLYDAPGIKGDFDPHSRDVLHVCRRVHLPSIGIDKYIESRIRPTYDEDRLVYYIITARDITAERDMYMKQREQDRQLRAGGKQHVCLELRYRSTSHRFLADTTQIGVQHNVRGVLLHHERGLTRGGHRRFPRCRAAREALQHRSFL